MMTIGLQAIPLQNIPFVADNVAYIVRIRFDGDDMMYMDVTANNEVIATSLPCLVGQQVMPYSYLEGDGGNFFWTTASGDNPMYTNFGAGDILLYGTNAEMAAERAAIEAAATAITLASDQAN
jgi:hypothetical protein